MDKKDFNRLQKDFNKSAEEVLKAIGNEIFGDDSKNLNFVLITRYDNGDKSSVGTATTLDPAMAFSLISVLAVKICKSKGMSHDDINDVLKEIYNDLK